MKIGEKVENVYTWQESQGSLEIAFCVKVTASSFFLGDSHIWLFRFSEQMLKSFHAWHITILFIFL